MDHAAIEALAEASLVSPEGPVWRVGPELRFGLAAAGQGREVSAGGVDVSELVRRLGELDPTEPAWVRAE